VRGSLDGGRATAVLVEGASGIGKTRLLFEVVRRVEEESRARLTVWRTGADLATARHPWSLVARAAGSAAPAIAQIVERERARGHEGDFPLGEFFAELLHAPVDEPSLMLRAAREDPALMRDQLRRTIRTIARDTLGFGPLLVVVDDAQFGDRESLDALALLLEESDENAGLCVLASVRDDVGVAPAWRGAHRVALGPLPTEARLELLLGALGESADVSRLALLASRSEGSPFWLEELARTEAEGATEELPATVVASVQSRLERLDRDARRLLRAASVFGGVFPLAPAAALAGLSRGSKEAALRALVDAEVLVEAQDGRFDIRHDITRRAAYGMLTEEDRLAAHAAVARWLESEDGSEPRLVADHFERAGLAREAVPHHAKAAVVALRSSDFGGAKTHAARGLEGSSEDETRGVLYHVLAEAAYWAGDTDGALEHAANVRRLAAPGSELWLDAARIEGALAIRRGLMDDVLGIARSLAEAEPVPGGERAFAGTAARLASHTYLAGDGALAGRLLARAEALLAASSERWPVVLATLHDARARRAELAHDHVGERAERREAVWAFDEVGDRRRGCISRTNLGVAELHLGLFEEARRSLEDARTIAVELGLEVAAAAAECNLGLVLFFVGDEARARLMLDASTARSKIAGDKRFEGACAAHLARLELAAGRVTGALHAGEEAARLLASSPTLEGYALAALADACLATGDVVRAVASSEQAAESARARALEEGDLYARLVHARALRAAGRRDEAVAALRETADELRARAARLDVPEVRRAFLERIPEHAEILALERELGTPLPG
jgi:tetratricopeptide (TPR) repeat protein